MKKILVKKILEKKILMKKKEFFFYVYNNTNNYLTVEKNYLAHKNNCLFYLKILGQSDFFQGWILEMLEILKIFTMKSFQSFITFDLSQITPFPATTVNKFYEVIHLFITQLLSNFFLSTRLLFSMSSEICKKYREYSILY